MILWLTGLSGAGKTTLGKLLAQELNRPIIDGDDLRTGLNSDLGYSREDRRESARRTAHIAKMYQSCVVAHISPYLEDRRLVKDICNPFFVYLDCGEKVLRSRDTKGFYKAGTALMDYEIGDFDLTVNTNQPIDINLQAILRSFYDYSNGYIWRNG